MDAGVRVVERFCDGSGCGSRDAGGCAGDAGGSRMDARLRVVVDVVQDRTGRHGRGLRARRLRARRLRTRRLRTRRRCCWCRPGDAVVRLDRVPDVGRRSDHGANVEARPLGNVLERLTVGRIIHRHVERVTEAANTTDVYGDEAVTLDDVDRDQVQ
jgi:hypothetical protein